MPISFRYAKSAIALPQDHGSWVFILSPLLIGLFSAGRFTIASFTLIFAALAAFLIRQPITIAIKAYSGRRSREDLPTARFWMMIYGTLLLLAITELIALGEIYILAAGAAAIPVFAWHLWLVSRRSERRQAGIEILATGVLALAAPAAYWVGRGDYSPIGWALWILTWFQSAASIVYAYLRLDQRQWKTRPETKDLIKQGYRALAYTLFNLSLSIVLSYFGIIPSLVWLAFLIQVVETIWGIFNPAIGAKPVAIGIRQLIVSVLFTLMFIISWR